MYYKETSAFIRTIKKLPDYKKEKVKDAISRLVHSLESKQTPHGLGLKQLRKGLWEIRAGIKDRVIFRLTSDFVEFIIVGDHDDIKSFLKRI